MPSILSITYPIQMTNIFLTCNDIYISEFINSFEDVKNSFTVGDEISTIKLHNHDDNL